MDISGPEMAKISQQLLELTREGRLTDWVERIGEIASRAGAVMENINWNGSPYIVAFEVIDHLSRRHASLDSLREALKI